MPRGGHRDGAGRKRSVTGGRDWIRRIVDDEDRRTRFRNALDAALVGWPSARNKSEAAGAAVAAYLRAFEHGYGRPPQALDIRTAEVGADDQLIYRAAFSDGVPLPAAPAAVSEETSD